MYSIGNDKGARADIIDYGAILVNLMIPDDKGEVKDIVLGYDNISDYEVNDCFFGATVGPNANRIAGFKFSIDGTEYETSSNGDGQYNAFMRALWKIYDRLGKKHPVLADYQVTIPPGGKTDALVATTIVWNMDGHEFKTRGIDSDQTEAAIKATVKMLNIIENLDLTTLK
jgi:D-citramalate synthase